MGVRSKHTKRRNLRHNARTRKKNEPNTKSKGTGHKPGTIIQFSDRTEYEVQPAGNWVRLKREIK